MINKKMSFVLLLGMIVVLALALAACGNSDSNDSTTEQPATDTEPTDDGETYTIRYSHNISPDTALGRAAEAFKEEVETESNGRLEVEIFPSLQLGSMREQAEQVQFGGAEMSMQGTSVLSPFTEDIQLLDLPFLFPTDEDMWRITQSEIGDELLETISDAGLKGLAIWGLGAKHFTNDEKPINGPEDIQGMSFRVMPSPLFIGQFEAWGANPTPIEFGELYNALQQGVVTGQDNDIETTYTQRFHEVQNYMTISSHNWLNYIVFANEEWFDGLPADLQEIITTATRNAGNMHHELRVSEEAELLENIIADGTEVNELPEEGRQAFIDMSDPVFEEFLASEVTRDLYQRIQDELGQ